MNEFTEALTDAYEPLLTALSRSTPAHLERVADASYVIVLPRRSLTISADGAPLPPSMGDVARWRVESPDAAASVTPRVPVLLLASDLLTAVR